MNDWAVLALIYLTLFLGSPLIVLLHELGHALAYLWLTKPESVDIHVGTYGSKTNTFSFKLGKINIYVSRSWRIIKSAGICVSSKLETDYRKHIVILLAGVFFTLFVACLPSLIVFCTHANLLLRIVCYMFLFLSAVSLLHNLIPFNIRGGNYGAALESDGKQIIFALKAKKHYAEYISAMQCVKTKDYKAAIEKLEIVNNAIPGSPKVVRYLNILNIQARQYDAAHHYFVELEKLTELQITDLINKGCLYSYTGKHDEAIAMYQKALKQNRNNVFALNNLGYEMVKKGAYKIAAQLFEKVLKLRPGFEITECNIAYSKLMQDQLFEAKAIIDKILTNNADCTYAYIHRAIYYLKMNNREMAEADIEKAKTIDNNVMTMDYEAELAKLSESVQL